MAARSKDTNAKHRHVAIKILANIRDRSGFDLDLDEDIEHEIVEELTELLYNEYGDLDWE